MWKEVFTSDWDILITDFDTFFLKKKRRKNINLFLTPLSRTFWNIRRYLYKKSMDIIWKGYKNEALKITYKNVIFVVSLFVKGKKLISYRAVLPIKTERAKVYKKKK